MKHSQIVIRGGRKGDAEATHLLSDDTHSFNTDEELVSTMIHLGRLAVEAELSLAYFVRVDAESQRSVYITTGQPWSYEAPIPPSETAPAEARHEEWSDAFQAVIDSGLGLWGDPAKLLGLSADLMREYMCSHVSDSAEEARIGRAESMTRALSAFVETNRFVARTPAVETDELTIAIIESGFCDNPALLLRCVGGALEGYLDGPRGEDPEDSKVKRKYKALIDSLLGMSEMTRGYYKL